MDIFKLIHIPRLTLTSLIRTSTPTEWKQLIGAKYCSLVSGLLCTLAETKIGSLVYANGWLGGTVVTITLLFTFITILFTVCLPTHLEQTKSVCAIIYLYVKKIVLCLKR
jgi:hypothetical protein